MRVISISLRKNDKIGSRIIRFATGEEFSHIGVQLGDDKIFQSDAHGCRVTLIDEFVDGNVVRAFYFKVSEEDFKQMRVRAISKLGYNYDFLGVIGFGLLLLAKKVGIKVKIPLMNPRWMMCSEYAEWILTGKQTTLTPGQVLEQFRENQV